MVHSLPYLSTQHLLSSYSVPSTEDTGWVRPRQTQVLPPWKLLIRLGRQTSKSTASIEHEEPGMQGSINCPSGDSSIFPSEYVIPWPSFQSSNSSWSTSGRCWTECIYLPSGFRCEARSPQHLTPVLHANTSPPKGHFNEELGSGISNRTLIFMISICKNLCFTPLFLLRRSLKMARNSQFLLILSRPPFSEDFLFGFRYFIRAGKES